MTAMHAPRAAGHPAGTGSLDQTPLTGRRDRAVPQRSAFWLLALVLTALQPSAAASTGLRPTWSEARPATSRTASTATA